MRRAASGLPAFAALLAALGTGCGDAGRVADVAAAGREALLPVESLRVSLSEGYEVRQRYAGRVVSRRSSDLGFERGGRIEAVLVDEGDRVDAGAVLVRLDVRELRARRRELEAQVRETEARLELAGRTSKRRAQLLENDSISPQRRDEAFFDAQALEARLAAARAAIESVDVDLELSTLVAPYPGSVTARLADEGSIVSPGQTILRLIEDGALEVRVGLPPATARELDPQGELEVEVAGRVHAARLHAMLDTVEPDTRTVTAIFHFVTPPEGVRNGSLARVVVEHRVSERGFWLPISALTESRRGLWSTFALVSEGGGDPASVRVERRELQVLHTESERAFVRGTLRDGDVIVATGLHRLVPGQRVAMAP